MLSRETRQIVNTTIVSTTEVHRHTRRDMLAALAAGATAALAAACQAGGTRQAEQPAGPDTRRAVTIGWGIRTGARPEDIDALITEWQQQYPNWKIERTELSGGIAPAMEKLTAALVSGVNIDVISGFLSAYQMNEALDALAPIEEYVRRDKYDTKRFNQDHLEFVGKYKGKLTALPFAYGGDGPAMLLNRGMFQAAGLSIPPPDWKSSWSWDDFRTILKRLTREEGGQLVQVGLASYGYIVNTPPLQWDAQWMTDDFKKIVCDSPEMIDCYTKYYDLLLRDRSMAASPGANLGGGDPFVNGKAGVTVRCCAIPPYTEQLTSIDWAFVPFPRGKTASPDIQAVIAGIGSQARNPGEGWKFVQFLLEKSRLAEAEKRQPAIIDDVEPYARRHWASLPDSRWQVFVEGTRIAKRVDPIRYHPMWQSMANDVITPTMTAVNRGEKGVVEALREMRPALQRIVDEYESKKRA